MAASDEDDVSIVVIEDNNSGEAIGFPDLRLRLTPSPGEQNKNSELEIKQAHTALSTAYTSLKGKLSKLENENKGLKAMLKKKGQDKMAMNNGRISSGSTADLIPKSTSCGGLSVPIGNTNGNSILRRHSARLEGDQHRRHGSWAYFNDTASPNHEQYVKFLEMQIENTEKEKSTLKMELEQLRLRFTDHEMSASKLKQDILRLEKENQQLKSDTSGNQYANRRVADHQNEELKKMNLCLQNQLKNIVDDYDRACALNKQLEERLQHKIDTQQHNLKPRYSHEETEDNLSHGGQVKDMGLFKSMMKMTTSLDDTLDSDDVNNLEYYVKQVKQQMDEVSMLKQLAAEQNQVIAELKQKLSEACRQGKASNSSLSVTMNPVPCEHDLETRRPSPTNSHNSFKYSSSIKRDITDFQDITHSKIPSQNSDNEHQTDEGNYSELFTQTVRDPVFASPPGVNGDAIPVNIHTITSCGLQPNLANFGGGQLNQPPPISVGGDETSDGGLFNSVEEGPITMQYDESEDFTIHHSGEGQTLVKNIQPSTRLLLKEQAAQNRVQQNVSVIPPPSPHRTSGSSSNEHMIRYPNIPSNGSSDEEVFDLNKTRQNNKHTLNNTDSVIRQGINIRDQYITSRNARLSQSENLSRIVIPPPSPLSPNNSHEARCNQSQAVRERTNIHSSPRHSDSSNPFNNLDGLSSTNPFNNVETIGNSNMITSNHHVNIMENRYRSGAQGTIPRPINIDRNLVTKDMHPPSYDNRSGHNNVNINRGSPREKLPSSSTSDIPSSYLNNQQILGELGQKPVATKNLESTYLTVKLPPVENTEELSDNTSDMRACPICSYLFPVHCQEQQRNYERHVEDCVRAFEPDITVPQEDPDFRKCPMCNQTFDFVTTDQSTFEKHVQSHFETHEDVAERFEVLNI